MSNKFNLDTIKEEMATRRSERNSVSEQLGEPISNNQAKDGFLNGLITSFKTGKETHSTKRIKLIENKVDIKEGKAPKFKENTTIEDINTIESYNKNTNFLQNDRDELMYNDLSKKALKNGQTLSESLMSLTGQGQQNNLQQNRSDLNHSQLNDGVKNIVNNYLAENFGFILEESIKNTLLEMYAVDRIKQVLIENKGLIKKIMYEILKENKSKEKT